MRVLIYPHDFHIGGSQLNAIQLASELARLGHQVLVYGRPGPLVDVVRGAGLEFIASPEPGRRPSLRVMRDLREVIRDRSIDIVHGYEWPPGLEAYWASQGTGASPVATVLSMAVAPFLPRTLPLIVGTEQLADAERFRGRPEVAVVEPPVDLRHDDPRHELGVNEFRARWGLDRRTPTVGVVTRLATELKLEGVLDAIRAVGELAAHEPVRLLIVGDGPGRQRVSTIASRVNTKRAEGTIVLTGELSDPRAAYASMDIALGMGSSALRAMAYGKPVIVQGEGGFWKTLTPDTMGQFLWTGWYGYGSETGETLGTQLSQLLDDAALRSSLGAFSRRLVEERFSLAEAAVRQAALYQRVRQSRPHRTLRDSVRTVVGLTGYETRRLLGTMRGHVVVDDFNARPLAREVEPKASGQRPGHRDVVLYYAGVSWDAVPGTDKNLVRELVRDRPVVWVDPPTPILHHLRAGARPRRISHLGPSLLRVHPLAPPALTKPLVSGLSFWISGREGVRAASRWGRSIHSIVVTSPQQPLPVTRGTVPKIYFETDDFVAGAELFGVRRARIERNRRTNVTRSTLVLGVTEELAAEVANGRRRYAALPNGCHPSASPRARGTMDLESLVLEKPIAGVVGQFNDRLDLHCVEAVARAGLNVLLVGPRRRMSPDNLLIWERLLKMPNVQWVGEKPADTVGAYLAQVRVGLTPYVVDKFNSASFPLKTMEYLAAGKVVVSTDLPAARQLDRALVRIGSDPESFAAETAGVLLGHAEPADREVLSALVDQYSWQSVAGRLHQILEQLREPQPGTTMP